MTAWVPLESNPQSLDDYIHQLKAPQSWHFEDVYGLDDDLLAMISQPVKAFILLFPITQNYDTYIKSLQLKDIDKAKYDVYYMQQTIQNACGSIAVIHALLNHIKELPNDSVLAKFYNDTKSKSYLERGQALEKMTEISEIHKQVSSQGQTEAPEAEDDVNLHFVCFVENRNNLFELDGNKNFPVQHGEIKESFVKSAASVMKSYMERDPDQVNFTILALCE